MTLHAEVPLTEIALVVDLDDAPLHWHLPPGRTAVAIPDSRELWDVLWTHRNRIGAVAHTHPGGGVPVPSREDLSTFAACEAGLGRRLQWWIVTRDHARCFRWCGPDRHEYGTCTATGEPDWIEALRSESFGVRGGL